MDMQYECDNAFRNLKCVPEPFFLEKTLHIYTYLQIIIYTYTLLHAIKYTQSVFPLRVQKEVVYLHPDIEFWMYSPLITAIILKNFDVLGISYGRKTSTWTLKEPSP